MRGPATGVRISRKKHCSLERKTMSAKRYSGVVTILLTYVDHDPKVPEQFPNGFYRCRLSRGVRREWSTAFIVGAPRVLSHAVDSSKAYDGAAHAALAFADADNAKWGEAAAYAIDGTTYHVGRSPSAAWPKDPAIHLQPTCDECGMHPCRPRMRSCGRGTCLSSALVKAKAIAGETSTCKHGPQAVTTCGACGRSWCDACDPTPTAQCHYCHGRGYTIALRETPTTMWKASTFTPAIRDRATVAHEKEKAAEAATLLDGTPQVLASSSHFIFAIVGDRKVKP